MKSRILLALVMILMVTMACSLVGGADEPADSQSATQPDDNAQSVSPDEPTDVSAPQEVEAPEDEPDPLAGDEDEDPEDEDDGRDAPDEDEDLHGLVEVPVESQPIGVLLLHLNRRPLRAARP